MRKATAHDLEYARETYRWYKLHGICVKCHTSDAMPDRVMCTDCAECARERSRMYYRKQDPVKRREYMREYMRAYRKAGRDVREYYEVD